MNLFQLVFKQMRQRALSTALTLLSVALGVALAVAVMIVLRGGGALFGQSDYGYDVLIGAKGSPLQLVLNTVYHLDKSPGNIPYSLYEALDHGEQYRPYVKLAVPYAVGDSYAGYRIVGTLPKLFGVGDDGKPLSGEVFEYRPGQKYELAEGTIFHPEKFEAVIGSEIAARTGLRIGSKFQATHGQPQPGEAPDIHDQQWTVVGVLKPTHTANDRVLFIPLISFYAISAHEEALADQALVNQGMDPTDVASRHAHPAGEHQGHEEHYKLRADGTIDVELPKSEWQVSAILVKSKGDVELSRLQYMFRNSSEVIAVNPAMVMREFFSNFLSNIILVFLLIAALVTVVAAVGILVSIYNSVAARIREIAILRALGATRARVLAIICLEAGLVGLFGGIAGLIGGHLIGWVASSYMRAAMGKGINWIATDRWEWLYLWAVVVIAAIAGLVPALKAYRTPVATNLVAA